MNDSEFHRLADGLWQTIEERIDDYDGDSDIDCEINGGVLVTVGNGLYAASGRKGQLSLIMTDTAASTARRCPDGATPQLQLPGCGTV